MFEVGRISARITKATHLTRSERLKRRLVALLTADVAGCSGLIREDEEGTLAQINSEPRITL